MSRSITGAAAVRLWHLVERQLMPRRCVFCGVETVADERFICSGCDADLPRIRSACRTCGNPLANAASTVCAACQAEALPFAALVAPLHYEFPVDAAIKALKYQRRLFYLPALTDLLLATTDELPGDIDAILPVPLHRWRKMKRGFNQAVELARPLVRSMQLPMLDSVLRRTHTPHQSGLTAVERQQNLRAAFTVRGAIAAQHVLIVDDVVTTGATCVQLARVLLAHGVETVSVLAVARA